MIQKNYYVGVVLGVLAFLPGCGKKTRYQSKDLPVLNEYNAQYHAVKNNVTLNVKRLDKQDTKDLFSNRGLKLLKNPEYLPVQFSIENKSNTNWTIQPESITLPQIPLKQVKKRLRKNTAGTIALIIVCGTLLAGTMGTAAFGMVALAMLTNYTIPLILMETVVAAGTAGIVTTPLASGIVGAQSKNYNTALNFDLDRVGLFENVTIEPNQKINKIIFAPVQDYSNTFNLSLTNNTDDSTLITYNVELTNNTQD